MIRLAALALCLAAPAAAQVATVGDIRLDAPMLRETPPNAPVAGGYVAITNAGAEDDVLVSATVDAAAAGEVQLHEMVMKGGVMEMGEVAGGIAIPAGGTVTLAPGGLHLMLMDLPAPLVAGGAVPVTLVFERAGAVTLDFPVLTLDEIRAAGEGAGRSMGHGAMGHGAAPAAGTDG